MTLIRRSARDGELELLYFDEAGFSCLPNVQRSWSPPGRPHAADASLGRKRTNVMGALDYARGQLHFEVCDHTVRREDLIRFLDHRAQSSPADKWTFLVMDNASMHHHIDPAITDRWLTQHRFLPLYLPLQPRVESHRNPLEACQIPLVHLQLLDQGYFGSGGSDASGRIWQQIPYSLCVIA